MLSQQVLYNGFIKILEDSNGFSENLLFVANKWTKVFEDFYIKMVAPISGMVNPNLYPSLNIFRSNLMMAIKNKIVKEQIETLIKTLHLGVCNGVTMMGIYTTTFPVAPLILKDLFNPKFNTKYLANNLSSRIFIWVNTTFSVQNSSGAVVKWM